MLNIIVTVRVVCLLYHFASRGCHLFWSILASLFSWQPKDPVWVSDWVIQAGVAAHGNVSIYSIEMSSTGEAQVVSSTKDVFYDPCKWSTLYCNVQNRIKTVLVYCLLTINPPSVFSSLSRGYSRCIRIEFIASMLLNKRLGSFSPSHKPEPEYNRPGCSRYIYLIQVKCTYK